MSLTLTESGKALTETQDGITMPADYSFDTVNNYVHGIDVHFEDLVSLCLAMANHIDKMQPQPIQKRQLVISEAGDINEKPM